MKVLHEGIGGIMLFLMNFRIDFILSKDLVLSIIQST